MRGRLKVGVQGRAIMGARLNQIVDAEVPMLRGEGTDLIFTKSATSMENLRLIIAGAMLLYPGEDDMQMPSILGQEAHTTIVLASV